MDNIMDVPISPEKKCPIQIMHLGGDKKGTTESYSSEVISFGRNPDCDIVFQLASLTVSRVHAKIIRKRNDYFLENISPNGSYLNGERVDQAKLNSGDVIEFSKSGPKIRVIYNPVSEASPSSTDHIPLAIDTDSPTILPELTVQYESDFRSFRQSSVLIGQDSECDIVMDHPQLFNKHAEIFLANSQFHIRNISRQGLVIINGRAINRDTLLQQNDIIELNSDGPKFKYLGDGKLIQQVEHPTSQFGPQRNDAMRTYIIPAQKTSFMNNLKKALQKKK